MRTAAATTNCKQAAADRMQAQHQAAVAAEAQAATSGLHTATISCMQKQHQAASSSSSDRLQTAAQRSSSKLRAEQRKLQAVAAATAGG